MKPEKIKVRTGRPSKLNITAHKQLSANRINEREGLSRQNGPDPESPFLFQASFSRQFQTGRAINLFRLLIHLAPS